MPPKLFREPVAALLLFSLTPLLLAVVGCHQPRKSQLDGVHRAALKIQSRTATGVTLLEYPEVISGLALELSLVKGFLFDKQDAAALKQYEEALYQYVSASEYWAGRGRLGYAERYALESYLRVTWRMADSYIEQADMLRHGVDPITTGQRKKVANEGP